ncbi:hypothetical protein E8E91_18080 [Pseudomonas sp. BN515]|nr:hypothetical protein [Pseudomonas sp. BN515]
MAIISIGGFYWLLAACRVDEFTPDNQDRVALWQIRERRTLDDIEAGRNPEAIAKCRKIWASLPGAGYGQNEHKLDDLLAHYLAAGGRLA